MKNNPAEKQQQHQESDDSKTFLMRRYTLCSLKSPSGKLHTHVEVVEDTEAVTPPDQRFREAFKQLFCGGVAGSVAKTVTAPFSRLTILFQVHSMVTTKEHRPNFAMSISGGTRKIIERGGILSLWKGNLTSVIHRFPYSAINFYCYENSLDLLVSAQKELQKQQQGGSATHDDNRVVTNKTSTFINGQASPFLCFLAESISGTSACVACFCGMVNEYYLMLLSDY